MIFYLFIFIIIVNIIKTHYFFTLIFIIIIIMSHVYVRLCVNACVSSYNTSRVIQNYC